jgi:hypothetical protein
MRTPTENKIGYLAYGNFRIPSNYTHTVNCRPWYGNDEHTPKGVECLLSVEFMLYENSYKDDDFTYLNTPLNQQINEARQQLLTPRKNLVIRGTGWAFKEYQGAQEAGSPDLRFPDVILGASDLGSDGVSYSGDISKSTVLGDLNHGPLPQEFNVEPIVGANAVKCTWKCLFWFNYCLGKPITSTDNFEFPIEFNYETSYSFQKNGRMRYTLAGTYSFYPYFYNTTSAEATIAVKARVDEFVQKRPVFYEPFVPDGFQIVDRSISFDNTQSKATFRFDIQEINSDNPYFPYVVNMDARHQVSSSIYNKDSGRGSGFSTWGNKLDVTVELMPYVHPRYAYEVFLTILMTRTRRPVDLGPIVGAGAQAAGLFKILPWPFNTFVQNRLTSVSKLGTIIIKSLVVTEGIYSNTHTFSAEWTSTCPLRLLAFSSGLFRYQGTKKQAWLSANNVAKDNLQQDRKNYNDKNEEFSLGLPFRPDNVMPTNSIAPSRLSSTYVLLGNPKIPALFFDPCPETIGNRQEPPFLNSPPTNLAREGFGPRAAAPTNKFIPTNLFDFDEFTIQQSQSEFIDPQNSYLSYNVSFEVIEDSRAYQVPINSGDALNQQPLLSKKIHTSQQAQITGPTDTTASMNANSGVYGGVGVGPSASQGSVIVAGGENTYKIVMRGSAARVLFPISCPAIVSVGGQIAVRAPDGKFNQRQVASSSVPLYRAEWEITYLVEGPLSNPHADLLQVIDPVTGNIVNVPGTNGLPNDYIAGRRFDGTGPINEPLV